MSVKVLLLLVFYLIGGLHASSEDGNGEQSSSVQQDGFSESE